MSSQGHCPAPSPQSLPSLFEPEVRYFLFPSLWAFPTQSLGLEAGAGWWGREDSHLGTGICGPHSEGCWIPLSGQRLGNPGTASPEPGPRRGSGGRSLSPAGGGLWSGSPGCGKEALPSGCPRDGVELAGWAEGSSRPQLWGDGIWPVIWMNAWVSGLGVGAGTGC